MEGDKEEVGFCSGRNAVGVDPAPVLRARLRPLFQTIFGAFTMLPAEEGNELHEALLNLTMPPREGQGVAGKARLRMLRHWRERQRRLLEAIDRVLLDMLAASSPEQEALRTALGEVIVRQKPRCRDLLRLRYGLKVETELVGVKLGQRQASPRKSTLGCLQALARDVLAWALEAEEKATTGI